MASRHASAEAVLALAPSIMRLVGAFHWACLASNRLRPLSTPPTTRTYMLAPSLISFIRYFDRSPEVRLRSRLARSRARKTACRRTGTHPNPFGAGIIF